MIRFGWSIALMCILATSALADKTQAKVLFREATQHYKLREFDAALEAFKGAYRNFEDPVFLYNIAQCHRQLGHKEEAIRFYRTYLHDVPGSPNEAEVRALISTLEREIQEDAESKKKAEATPTPPPPIAAPVPAPGHVDAPAPTLVAKPAADKPVYKKWWLWTTIGAVAVVGAGLGVGLAVGLPGPKAPAVQSSLGTYHPEF